MRKFSILILLVIFGIMISSCSLMRDFQNVSVDRDYRYDYIEEVIVKGDTVFIILTHTHTIIVKEVEVEPLNNDWIIIP